MFIPQTFQCFSPLGFPTVFHMLRKDPQVPVPFIWFNKRVFSDFVGCCRFPGVPALSLFSLPAHAVLSVLGVRFAMTLWYLMNSGNHQQPGERGQVRGSRRSLLQHGCGAQRSWQPPHPHRLQAGRDQLSLFNVSLQLHEAPRPGQVMVPSPPAATGVTAVGDSGW